MVLGLRQEVQALWNSREVTRHLLVGEAAAAVVSVLSAATASAAAAANAAALQDPHKNVIRE